MNEVRVSTCVFQRGSGRGCRDCGGLLEEHTHMWLHHWSAAGPYLTAPSEVVPVTPAILEPILQGEAHYIDWDTYI